MGVNLLQQVVYFFRSTSRFWLAAHWFAALSVCAIALNWFNGMDVPGAMPAIFVGGLATCGWLLTNFNARRNQAEKNAYDLILLYQKEKYYVDHRAEIHKRFAPYVEIDAANAKLLVSEYYDQGSYSPPAAEISLPGKGQRSAAYSLVQIINFYEYLAIGIKRGILSDNLCRAYFRTTLSNFNRKKARRFVDEVINRELSERKDISRSSIFSNYLWLLNHWRC